MGDRWIRYANILPLMRAHQRHHLTDPSAHSNRPSPGGDQPCTFLTWQRNAWVACWTEMKTVSIVFSENTPRTSGPPAPYRGCAGQRVQYNGHQASGDGGVSRLVYRPSTTKRDRMPLTLVVRIAL